MAKAKKAVKKVERPGEINGLPKAREYKFAKDRDLGFKPFERRVMMQCFAKGGLLRWTRWFARIETARRRLMDLAEDNGYLGDVIEVAHVRGLQYYTATVKVDGVMIKRNPDAFV